MLTSIGITLATFIIMEGITWCTHKYLMHGLMWYFHQDHHQPSEGFFEKNDTFFLIFAIPSFLLFLFGAMNGYDFRFFIGAGIALYGLAYFLVHDVMIHRRFTFLDNVKSPYFMALRKAHSTHHKHMDKEDGECFGMLYVPWKFYKDAWRKVKS